jgi:outer membrane protein
MKFIKFLLIIFIIFSYNIANAKEVIVFCDMDYIINNSIAGKNFSIKLEKKDKSNLESLKKIEKELKDKELNILKQKNVLSEDEYEKKVIDLKKEVLIFNKSKKNKFNEINKMKLDAKIFLIKKLNTILSDYSKENSISIILPKNNIIIGKSELDITEKIIKIINQEVKKIELK